MWRYVTVFVVFLNQEPTDFNPSAMQFRKLFLMTAISFAYCIFILLVICAV